MRTFEDLRHRCGAERRSGRAVDAVSPVDTGLFVALDAARNLGSTRDCQDQSTGKAGTLDPGVDRTYELFHAHAVAVEE